MPSVVKTTQRLPRLEGGDSPRSLGVSLAADPISQINTMDDNDGTVMSSQSRTKAVPDSVAVPTERKQKFKKRKKRAKKILYTVGKAFASPWIPVRR